MSTINKKKDSKKITLSTKLMILAIIISWLFLTLAFMNGHEPTPFAGSVLVGFFVSVFSVPFIYFFIWGLYYRNIPEKKEKMVGAFVVSIVLIALLSLYLVNEETVEERKAKELAIEEKLEAERVYIDESLTELHLRFFDSQLTDLQKKALWNSYKGKYVKWEGYVKDSDKNLLGQYVVLVNINPIQKYTLSNQATIEIKESEIKNLLRYSKNSLIRFEGKLQSFDNFGKYFYIKEGKINKVKENGST